MTLARIDEIRFLVQPTHGKLPMSKGLCSRIVFRSIDSTANLVQLNKFNQMYVFNYSDSIIELIIRELFTIEDAG